jgi:hypothetical protein
MGEEAEVVSILDASRCPKCGEPEPVLGFGLAGGGYGPYALCNNADCDWFVKMPAEEDEGDG